MFYMAREICEDKSRNIISSGGFCYSDVSSCNPTIHQTHMMNQIQGFEGNPSSSEIFFNLEMIGFSKNLQQQHTTTAATAADSNSVIWNNKGFFNNNNKPGNNHGPSSSKTINESTTSDHHHHHFYQHDDFSKRDLTTGISSETSGDENNLMAADAVPWQENNNNSSRMLVDDSSLRCVFPCEGNERPSQGLSLSLSSTNPSNIGLQSFELRQTNQNSNVQQEGFFGKPAASIHQQQQQMIEDGFLGKSSSIHHHLQTGQFHLRNSKFLAPAQELLNEFCWLGTKQMDTTKQKSHKSKQWDDENASCSSTKQSLGSLEFMELQKRKTKLLSMLDEVDRRYRHYCDQMKAVVSYFEAMAGNGAATVYSALASKAMSRHFRCLRDGIVGQIQATKKAMGEKDAVAPGTSKGETPRLKIIDQALRQQRAFQQMTMMESHPWRPQRGLPERSVSVLRAWLFEHFLHPYPSDVDKHILARQTGLSRSQVSNWFINARVRLWKPMVEEMYLEETKEQDNNSASSDDNFGRPNKNQNQNQNQNPLAHHDQKPTQDQLFQFDSECLSSIINNPGDKNDANKTTIKALHHQNHHHMQQNFGSSSSFGAMQLDFSSYNDQHTVVVGGVSYANDNANHHHQNNFNGVGGGGVSLTLGLQQHGGNGVSLAFSPTSQSSLFYPRDSIADCQPVQYSILDGDHHQGQNLPYRNLTGAQFLHDLAG